MTPMDDHDTTLMKTEKSDILVLAGMSLCLFLYHVLAGLLSGYGYFIDELYHIACSRQLAAGYVDHPPFSMEKEWPNFKMFD